MRTQLAYRESVLAGLGVAVDGGFVRFYDGPQPTDPDTFLLGNTLIVECVLNSPALGTISGAVGYLNAIGAGVIAASGTPTFARFLSTSEEAYVDMTVGTEIVLTKEAWEAGEPFPAPSISWSLPVGP